MGIENSLYLASGISVLVAIAFGFMAMFAAAYLYVHIRKGLGLPTKSEATGEVSQ